MEPAEIYLRALIVDTNAKPLRDYGDYFADVFFWKDNKHWKGAKHIKL